MTSSESLASPIQQRLMTFIKREFEADFRISKLLGDASTRQYFRLVDREGQSFVVAAYPEAFNEENFSYLQIHGLLEEIGVPVPRVFAVDGDLGIVLQEDLGDISLQRSLIHSSAAERRRRFSEVIDLILLIQREGGPRLKPEWEANRLAFDREKLLWEFHFFSRHYLGNYRKRIAYDSSGLEPEFQRIAAELADVARVLCHRDLHVRNLILHQVRLHVLDFQDARWGPPSYDLCSLLKDSIDLTPEEVVWLVELYLDRARLPGAREGFWRLFHLSVVQRMLKALGTYGYQIVVRENFIYEQYISGTLQRALFALRTLAEFPAIRRLVENETDRARIE